MKKIETIFQMLEEKTKIIFRGKLKHGAGNVGQTQRI